MPGDPSLAQHYREVTVKTASPLQLIVILYDAAICCMQEARDRLEHKDIAGRTLWLNKCIAILSELQSSLDLKAGEVAGSLDRLYSYIKRRIFTANTDQEVQPLDEVQALLENLRSAWAELVSQSHDASVHAGGWQFPDAISAAIIHPRSVNLSI